MDATILEGKPEEIGIAVEERRFPTEEDLYLYPELQSVAT